MKIVADDGYFRILSTYAVKGSFRINTALLDDFSMAMNNNDITFHKMFKLIGKWLVYNYDRLPHYRIEVTTFNAGLTKAVNGIRYCESLKDPNWTPLANTFRFLCRMEQFEH